MKVPSPGITFLVAAAVLAGAAFGGVLLLGSSVRTGHDHGTLDVGDDRVVMAKTVRMGQGDRLVVRPEFLGGPISVLGEYDFYVAPGGSRYAFLDGDPPTPHVRVEGLRVGTCCSRGDVVWDRPDAPGPAPAPRPFAPDADERTLATEALRDPAYVDLVWVFAYREGFRPPDDPGERRTLDGSLEAHFRDASFGSPFGAMPSVVSAATARLAPYLLATMALSALTATAAAVAWLRRRWRAPDAVAADGTEGLLRLYTAAGAYLTAIRDLLVASLAVVVLVALHVALEGEPAPLLYLAARAGIGAGLGSAVGWTLVALYAAILGGWIVTLVRVQRALNAWRRRAAVPPLET